MQGGTPCKAPTQHHPAAAVLPVQWQGANGGLMFTSASRWRRSRRTGQNGGSQAVRPQPDRVEIFAPGENTTRCLTATKPERQGEGQAHGEDRGEREGGTPSPVWGAVSPRPPNRYRVNLSSKPRKPLILLVFLGFCLYRNMSTFVSNFQHKCIEKKYTNVLTTAILPCRIFLSGKTNVSNKKVHLLPEIIS